MCELALEEDWGAAAFDLRIIETDESYEPEAEFLDFRAMTANWRALPDGEVARVPL